MLARVRASMLVVIAASGHAGGEPARRACAPPPPPSGIMTRHRAARLACMPLRTSCSRRKRSLAQSKVGRRAHPIMGWG